MINFLRIGALRLQFFVNKKFFFIIRLIFNFRYWMLDKLNSIKEKVFNSFEWKNSSSNIFWVVNKIDEKYLPLMEIVNWKKPFYEVRKEIKDLVNDPAKNKEFLLMLWDTSSWKALYESLIDISYNKLEEKLKWLNSKEKVEAKNLLKEVKSNALRIFSSVFSEISDDVFWF